MTDAQTYYDGLIQQGYPLDQALGYTQQYFPGFVPVDKASIPAPQPVQPVVQQSVQANTEPPAQHISQPIARQNDSIAATIGGESKPVMAWSVIACITTALLLTLVGQFGNSWQISSEDDSVTLGLTSIMIDCSKQQNEQNCISSSYVLVAEDMDQAGRESPPANQVLKGKIEDYCENMYKLDLDLATSTDNNSLRIESGENRETCLKNDSAGEITGIVLWIGLIGVLAAIVMFVASIIGQTLPGGAEVYGRITSMTSGALIILTSFLWMIMKDNLDGNMVIGGSFYASLFAGLFAVGASILDVFDERK